MLLESIHIVNFRSHKNTQINFQYGTTVIVGDNGSGKSTIIDAILFALSGERWEKREGLKLDNFIRWNESGMSVSLIFMADGVRYRVKRSKILNRNTTATLDVWDGNGWKNIASKQRGVDEKLSEILNLNEIETSVVRQGELTKILKQKPSERKEYFHKLLNLEEMEKFHDDFGKYTKDFEAIANELKGIIGNEGVLIKRKDEKLKEIVELKKLKENLENEKKILENELAEKKKIYDEECAKKEMYVQISNEISLCENEIKNVQKRLNEKEKELKRIEEIEKTVPLLKEEVKKFEELKKKKEKADEVLNLKKEYKVFKEKENEYNKHISKISALQEAENEYIKIYEEIENLKEKIGILKIYVDELARLEKEEKEIKEKISKCLEYINDIEEKYFKIFNEKADLEKINKIPEKRENLRKEIEKLTKEREILKEREQELSVNIKNLEKQRKELLEAESICPVCESPLPNEKKENLLKNAYQNEEKTKNERKEITKKINEIEANKSNKEKQLKAIEDINNELFIEKYNERNELNAKIEQIKENKKEVEIKKKEYEKYNKMLNEKIKIFDELKEKHNYYIYSKKFVESTNIEEIKENMNKILNEINAIICTNELPCTIENVENYITEVKQKLSVLEKKKEILAINEEEVKKKDEIIRFINEEKANEYNLIKKKNELICKRTEIDYDEKRHDEISKIYENARIKMQETENNISKNNALIFAYENQLKEIESDLKKIEIAKEEEEILNAFLNFSKEIREKFGKNGIQKDISQSFFPILETYTNNLFSTFGFPYESVEIYEDEENCHINLKKGRNKISAAALSGGEKTALSIALNAALSKLIGKADFLILDEPTESLDEGKVNELIEILKEFKGISQLIVISHDRDFKNATRSRIEVYKENGISHIAGEEKWDIDESEISKEIRTAQKGLFEF